MGSRTGESGLVLRDLRGRFAGVGVVLDGVLLHEHRHQKFEQHQQRPEQVAVFGRHPAFGALLRETLLERDEFLAQATIAGDEVERQYWDVLGRFDAGLLFYYFGNGNEQLVTMLVQRGI